MLTSSDSLKSVTPYLNTSLMTPSCSHSWRRPWYHWWLPFQCICCLQPRCLAQSQWCPHNQCPGHLWFFHVVSPYPEQLGRVCCWHPHVSQFTDLNIPEGKYFLEDAGFLLRFNLVRVETHELRPEVVTEDDEVLVHYRSRTNVWQGLPSKTLT